MKYIYKQFRNRNIIQSLQKINFAAKRLHEKLIRLDIREIGISEYNQRYLSEKLNNPVETLQLYTYLLSQTLLNNKTDLSEYVFVDYGGGHGLLSLLAKELGIGTVIYNDIYDVSCNDVKIISEKLELKLDGFVCGDIDDLIGYVNDKSITINAICSYDVIEHIYDIEDYLKKLRLISNNSFRIVFGSGANMYNPIINKQLIKTQLQFENEGREKVWGHKERDSLKSFIKIRKDIITAYNSSLCSNDVQIIAKQTRGLIKHDIEKCVDEFVANGVIQYKNDHPTNTCDPNTGNWTEHLMDTNWLKSILVNEGFKVEIKKGFYSYSNFTPKNFVKNLLNLGSEILGKKSLTLSPYYIVFADYIRK